MNSKQISFGRFWSDLIPQLPQAAAIKEADARLWYQSAVDDPFRDISWHYENLFGFNGADAAVILAQHFHVSTWYSDLSALIEEKLMRRPVSASRFAQSESAAMEPLLKSWFRAATKAAKASYSLAPKRFVLGKPHDVLTIGGETVIVGYQHSPERLPPPADEIPFHLAALLTHYRQVIDIQVDRSLLVFSDQNAATGFRALEVPSLPEMDRAWDPALQEAAQLVLSGRVPEREIAAFAPSKEWDEVPSEIKDKIYALEKEFVVSDLLRRESVRAFQTAKAALSEIFRTIDLPMVKWVPRLTTGIIKQEVDDALAQEMIRVLRLDEEDFKRRGDPDATAALHALTTTHTGLSNSLRKLNSIIARLPTTSATPESRGSLRIALLRLADALQALPSEPTADHLYGRVWDPQKLGFEADKYQIPTPVIFNVSASFSANQRLGISSSDLERKREIAREAIKTAAKALHGTLFPDNLDAEDENTFLHFSGG